MKRVYLKEIETKSHEIMDYSKNVIAEKIAQMKNLPEEIEWKGKARDSYVNTYKTKIAELEKLNNNIYKIAEFLLMVNEKYGNANYSIGNAHEELVSEFKKIGGKYGM